MRWLLPLVLIGVALGGFFLITSPIYDDILILQKQSDVYEQALQNSASLQKERDRLTSKFNSFSQEDMTKLEKMLPNSVDNIQLILEMQQEASKRGIIVKNVQFSPEQFLNQTATTAGTSSAVNNTTAAQTKTANSTGTTNRTGRVASADDNKDYEAFELEFSVEGPYKDFVEFMELMERSLRLIDINTISFTPGTSEKDKKYSDNYRYLFKINTYRLKD
jgi:Tfp pilus assembly protein PilO